MQIGVHKVAMAAPNDVSELAKLIDSGVVNPSEIVALIGKTEGNGGANDFTRGYATLVVPDSAGEASRHLARGGRPQDRLRVVGRHRRRALAARDACSRARPRGQGERSTPGDGDRGHARHPAGRSRHDGASATRSRRRRGAAWRRPASPTRRTCTTCR